MTENNSQQYPFQPPPDESLTYDENLVIHRKNPQGIDKLAKFCGVCNYPITLCVICIPCRHFFCYKCYSEDTYECRICEEVIKEILIKTDNEKFYSFDQEQSSLYFESYDQLQQHIEQHEALNQN